MRNLLLAVFILTITVYAAVDTLQPDATLGKDAFVYEGMSSDNFGTSDHLSVTSSTQGHQAISYIEFTQLPGYFGTTIHQATLELFVTDLSNTGATVECAATAATWDENSIAWQNQPGPMSGTEQQEPYPTNVATWWSVDVTGIVLDWANDTYNHYGFVILDDTGDAEMARFATSDESNSTLWPKLILDYTGDVGVKSLSIGELKVVFR